MPQQWDKKSALGKCLIAFVASKPELVGVHRIGGNQWYTDQNMTLPNFLNYAASCLVRDAILLRSIHVELMATYQIIPSGDGSGFNIGVAGSDGTRQTMLGFTSMEEAEAWIMQDRRLTGVPDHHFSDGFTNHAT